MCAHNDGDGTLHVQQTHHRTSLQYTVDGTAQRAQAPHTTTPTHMQTLMHHARMQQWLHVVRECTHTYTLMPCSSCMRATLMQHACMHPTHTHVTARTHAHCTQACVHATLMQLQHAYTLMPCSCSMRACMQQCACAHSVQCVQRVQRTSTSTHQHPTPTHTNTHNDPHSHVVTMYVCMYNRPTAPP